MLATLTELIVRDCTGPGADRGRHIINVATITSKMKVILYVPASPVAVMANCDGTLLVTLLTAVSEIRNKLYSSTGDSSLLLKV